MSSCHILAVHGFLGTGQDWQMVESALVAKTKNEIHWIKPDLFSKKNDISYEDLKSFETAADKLIQSTPQSSQKIFIGYSLGARIGLHLLEKYADQFRAFIFISAHPGLEIESQKNERRINDNQWNQKLRSLSWDDFYKQWTDQPVFSQDKFFKKSIVDMDVDKLSHGLTSLSLAEQQNKNHVLIKNQNKVFWVVGDNDAKFCNLAEDLIQKKILSSYERIFSSGHRVLFDQPSELADILLKITDY